MEANVYSTSFIQRNVTILQKEGLLSSSQHLHRIIRNPLMTKIIIHKFSICLSQSLRNLISSTVYLN